MTNREELEIADELDAMAERITRYSNNTGDGLCTRAAQLLRALSRSQDVARVAEGWKTAVEWVKNNYQDWMTVDELCNAMLAAAPQPPQAGAITINDAALDTLFNHALRSTTGRDSFKKMARELLATAAPAVASEATVPKWVFDNLADTLEPAWDYIQTHQDRFGAMAGDDKTKILVDEFLRHARTNAAPAPAAPKEERQAIDAKEFAALQGWLQTNAKSWRLHGAGLAAWALTALERLHAKPEQHDDYEAKGTIEHLDLDNHRLRRAMQKIMARLTELLDEDQFANIESIVKGVGVEPPEQREPTGEQQAIADKLQDAAVYQSIADNYAQDAKPEPKYGPNKFGEARDRFISDEPVIASDRVKALAHKALSEAKPEQRATLTLDELSALAKKHSNGYITLSTGPSWYFTADGLRGLLAELPEQRAATLSVEQQAYPKSCMAHSGPDCTECDGKGVWPPDQHVAALSEEHRKAIVDAVAWLWNYRRVEARHTIDALRALLAANNGGSNE
jgi:hypothetical protein